MDSSNRKCSQCASELKGRIGQRFCSDQCRATHHNLEKLQNRGEQLIKEVNIILRRNRTILRQASPEGKTTVNRQVLERAGFDFRYFTNLYRTQKGNTYHFCYDYGYLLLPEDKVLIVNQQPYMNS
jgi:hypothetical protein